MMNGNEENNNNTEKRFDGLPSVFDRVFSFAPLILAAAGIFLLHPEFLFASLIVGLADRKARGVTTQQNRAALICSVAGLSIFLLFCVTAPIFINLLNKY